MTTEDRYYDETEDLFNEKLAWRRQRQNLDRLTEDFDFRATRREARRRSLREKQIGLR